MAKRQKKSAKTTRRFVHPWKKNEDMATHKVTAKNGYMTNGAGAGRRFQTPGRNKAEKVGKNDG